MEYVTPIVFNGKPCMGVTLGDMNLIQIDVALSDKDMRETLLHEIRHVYFFRSPMKLTDAQVEKLCDHFGSAVRDLAENNDLSWLKR